MELVLALSMGVPPSVPGDLTFVPEMIDKDNVFEAQLPPPPCAIPRRATKNINFRYIRSNPVLYFRAKPP